uniref:BHLH domain-containing protein n=1 Tax=Oryza brachyantha TaxID=4533 RepID=J3KVP9_ORYBR
MQQDGTRTTQMSSLDEAAAYIKKLKERVDELQHRSRSMATSGAGGHGAVSPSTSGAGAVGSDHDDYYSAGADGEETTAPVLEVRHHVQDGSSSLDVVLICSARGEAGEVPRGDRRPRGRRRRDPQRQLLLRRQQNLLHRLLPGL